MFGEREREIFARLKMPYEAVAVRFCRNRPEGYAQAEGKDKLCVFLRRAQDGADPFFITVDNEDCMGKVVLGMTDLETNHASGQVGCAMGMFRTPAANARLYYQAPMFRRGTVNYVLFAPVSKCAFQPDLVVCVADTDSGQLLLRASSYRSGDLWESKCACVMSCAWTYVYPYLSGKINHLFTGMHMGLRLEGLYPPGLHILAIPYQKLDEVMDSLEEMDWNPVGMVKDEHSGAVMEEMDRLREDIRRPFPVN